MHSFVLAPLQEYYQVGDLLIDFGRRRVTRNEVEIPLPRLSFDLLVALTRSYPVMLTTDELMESVWSPAVVNPETVAQRIKLLRQSLGDNPRQPRYIVSVRGRGYRMEAPVQRRECDPADSASAGADSSRSPAEIAPSEQPAPAEGTRSGPHRITLAVGVSLSLLLCILGAIEFWPPPRAELARTAQREVARPHSLAVLPFVDMSEHADHQYFADGLTEELVNGLAMVPGLHVAARTSSFYFKGKRATVAEIGQALGVAHLLEGSVRESANTIRITTQLVEVDNGQHVWSATFEQPRGDPFKLQDEIAGSVIQALRLSIIYRRPIAAEPTHNIEAFTLYLRAFSNVVGNGVDNYAAAKEQLRSAVALDPQFAAAWTLLALVDIWKFDLRAPPTAAACVDARAAADRALEFNSHLGEAHRASGIILQYCDADLTAAEAEFNRALELAPENDDALRSYSYLMTVVGRSDYALQLARRAVARDPLNPWNFIAVGDAAWRLGQLIVAEAAYRAAVALQPAAVGLHALFANLLLSEHKPLEAVAEAEKEPDSQLRRRTLVLALDAADRRGNADAEIASYEMAHADDDPGELGVFFACRHDADRAIRWFTKFSATQEGEFVTWRSWMRTLPNRMACLNSIASDPRYPSLQQRIRKENARGRQAMANLLPITRQ